MSDETEDFSDNGTDPDPDGDGDPNEAGENDPTPIDVAPAIPTLPTVAFGLLATLLIASALKISKAAARLGAEPRP